MEHILFTEWGEKTHRRPRGGMSSVEKRSSYFNRLIIVRLAQTPKELKKKKAVSYLPGILPNFISPCFQFLSFLIHFQRFYAFPDLALTRKLTRPQYRQWPHGCCWGFRGNCLGVFSKVSCRKFYEFIVLECSWRNPPEGPVWCEKKKKKKKCSRNTLISPESDIFHHTATLVLLRMWECGEVGRKGGRGVAAVTFRCGERKWGWRTEGGREGSRRKTCWGISHRGKALCSACSLEIN